MKVYAENNASSTPRNMNAQEQRVYNNMRTAGRSRAEAGTTVRNGRRRANAAQSR